MKQAIENLIHFEIENQTISKRDYRYVKNQLYHLLNIKMDTKTIEPKPIKYPSEALNPILNALEKESVLDGSVVARDLFDAKIMNIFASLPSTVEQRFFSLKGQKRTTWLYHYAQSLNYIRVNRILKNQSFYYDSSFGKLQITINLSKPEKDPLSIARAKQLSQNDYPTCVLCCENEGFSGHAGRDSRDQHRLIRFNLNEEPWYFQYSPYTYYNEHAIVLCGEHRPMHISAQTFANLLELTNLFDGYFFGSNADLPIVGGSILTHDHYQGGRHHFPIESARVLKSYQKNDVTIELLQWPLSTIRLSSSSEKSLVHLAQQFLNHWQNYDNLALNIKSHTEQTPHHTITPIARKKQDTYELDLVLRDNRTTDEFPLGIFHPHQDKWHIKKENIGLIEAMGLAVLPKRLVEELKEVKAYILKQTPLSHQSSIHQTWIDQIKDTLNMKHLDDALNQAVGFVFEQVLVDCGVFKLDNQGLAAFKQFITEVLS